MRLLLVAMLVLLVSARAARAAEGRLSVNEEGNPTVSVPGRTTVSSQLFLWYDRWVWRSPQTRPAEGENKWKGTFSKREEDGPGSIAFTGRARRTRDGVRLELEFERDGEMDLTRGIFLSFSLPFPEYRGTDLTFSHGPPHRLETDFRQPARTCTVALSPDAALHIDRGGATVFEGRARENHGTVNVRLVPADMGEQATATLDLRLVSPPGGGPSWRAESREEALEIGHVRPSAREVPRHEPVEFSVDLGATYENPFDPQQVRLDAEFRTPGGGVEGVPGYYHQGFRAEYEKGLELLALDGEPTWKVRYMPREAGEYEAVFTAWDSTADRQVTSDTVRFRCTPSDAPGFVRVRAPEAGGPKYFRLTDGGSLWLIGHNVTTYYGGLEAAFRKMAAGGENYTRFWMWSHGLGLEWDRPVGRYRLEEAWRLDRTFRLARRHGLHLMLCLDTHQDFRESGWEDNPYNAANGGPCKKPLDFVRKERARKLYKRRLRYVVARWGYHPNLLCWEFVNEIEGWPGAQENRDVVAEWHREMAEYLDELDPFDHPITSSQWTTEGWPELWDLPQMDLVQSHYYANSMWADMAGDVAQICAQKRRDWPDKLHVFGEYGVHYRGGTAEVDPGGVHLHNGNWAALMSGAASNPVSWWHRDYIDPMGLYEVYRGVAKFVEHEPLADRSWRTVQVESVEYREPPREPTYRDLQFSGVRSGWGGPVAADTRFVLRRDGTVENVEELPGLLHGPAHSDLKSPFVFELDCPKPARFEVHVGTVSAGAKLVFELDGETVRTVELPAGEQAGKRNEWQEQWEIWQSTYDESYGIELPAGEHTVTIRNEGHDWMQIGYFRVTDYLTDEEPPLRVLGLRARDRVLLWVQNEAHTWFNVRAERPVPVVRPTRVRLTGVSDGRWAVERWDTRTGEVLGRVETAAEGGALELEVPQVETDMAFKLKAR